MTKSEVKPEAPTFAERSAALAATLDARIVSMLATLSAPNDMRAVLITCLLDEIRQAIAVAEREGREAQARAFDPSVPLDPTAQGKVHDAEHKIRRLTNAREALVPHHEAALKREAREKWEESIRDLELRVVSLSKELLSTYPEAVAKLVDLFRRCAEADKEVMLVNANAADGLRRLRGVESTATNGDTKIISKVKLPTLTVEGHTTAIDAWPPPQPSVGIELSNAVLAAARSGMMRPPTEAERAAESKRVMEYYEQQEQGRERLAAEAHAKAELAAAARRMAEAGA